MSYLDVKLSSSLLKFAISGEVEVKSVTFLVNESTPAPPAFKVSSSFPSCPKLNFKAEAAKTLTSLDVALIIRLLSNIKLLSLANAPTSEALARS